MAQVVAVMTRDPEPQTKEAKMKKFRAVNESHQRVYYEAIFEAEDEDDAERMVALMVWSPGTKLVPR